MTYFMVGGIIICSLALAYFCSVTCSKCRITVGPGAGCDCRKNKCPHCGKEISDGLKYRGFEGPG
ncbi:hypothetical protein LCGC14_1162670 [marine sediment metagenome]|uniref:Uncharacterized protein n=1 Tax=marine sediment metagenome TaxID=412755 RepID=A0A0F9LX75_9ZZZZ